MKTEAELSDLVPDKNNVVTRWVCQGLGFDTEWLRNYQTFGVVRDKCLLAGIIFHDARFGQDVWWTIYSQDKRWGTRRIIKKLMFEAFGKLQCRRINVLVDADNKVCLKLLKQLNFKVEGCLRKFGDKGQNRYILGLLKSENKYIWKGE